MAKGTYLFIGILLSCAPLCLSVAHTVQVVAFRLPKKSTRLESISVNENRYSILLDN